MPLPEPFLSDRSAASPTRRQFGRAFQTLDPEVALQEVLSRHPAGQGVSLGAVRLGLQRAELEGLREQNRKWFAEPMTSKPIALVWLINQEFTRRGIAPRWRGLPEFVKTMAGPQVRLEDFPSGLGLVPIGDPARKARLLRWIDLEWLASALGPGHVGDHAPWARLFVCGLDSGLAHRIANSHERPHHVVSKLGVLRPHSFALKGLMTRDDGERCATAEKRLKTRYRPVLEGQMRRGLNPLSREQVENRLLWCEAIELANGSPTVAAQLYSWMTGVSVTRQTAHEIRTKLAKQLRLTSAAWAPESRKCK